MWFVIALLQASGLPHFLLFRVYVYVTNSCGYVLLGLFCFLVERDDTEAVVRDVCLETAKTEENVRKYIKVSQKFLGFFPYVMSIRDWTGSTATIVHGSGTAVLTSNFPSVIVPISLQYIVSTAAMVGQSAGVVFAWVMSIRLDREHR